MSDIRNYKYFKNYGILFGEGSNYGFFKHSFEDFNLFPRTKPVIEPPKPKTLTVEIPGANGVIDFTEALTGTVQYANREGTFEYVFPYDRKLWDSEYHQLLRYCHGKRMRVILDEDPGGYYEGRITVEPPKYENGRAFFTIKGDFAPFRYDLYGTTEPWIWDTFNFDTGVIRYYNRIEVNSNEWVEKTIIGSDMQVVPDLILIDGLVGVNYPSADGGYRYLQLESGSNITNTPDFIIGPGEHIIQIRGQGTMSIDYRAGWL